MIDISISGLVKEFEVGKRILDGLSFQVDQGERVGLLGKNGAGKTTLFKILTGELDHDEGQVSIAPGKGLGLISQIPVYPPDYTVEDVLQTAFHKLQAMEDEMAQLTRQMEGDSDPALLKRYGALSSAFEAAGGYDTETERNKVCNGLDIPPDMRAQRFASLSGGEKTRVNLARLILEDTDILLLDEPTNHLDSDMVLWLEDTLKAWRGALVMVTHDRYFLERIAGRIAEVDRGSLYLYEGNYDKFLERKAQREESALASERKRQAILRREYQWVMQGPTARGTKSRERLERYEALKAQTGPEEKTALELSARSSRLGKKTITLEGVGKAFGTRTVLRDFSCQLLRDDRIGIVGANGSGKSTLLHLIAGVLPPDSGTVEVGETVRMGYFRQEVPQMDGSTLTTCGTSASASKPPRAWSPPPSCWNSSCSPRRSSGAPSGSSPAGRSGGSICSPSWPPPPTSCCWTSPPTTWT